MTVNFKFRLYIYYLNICNNTNAKYAFTADHFFFGILSGKLYNVDGALLHSQQEKHAILMEHLERLERESQTVSVYMFPSLLIYRVHSDHENYFKSKI